MTEASNDKADGLLPYRHITEPHYAELAAQNFVIEDSLGGLVLHGSCPRCSDIMDFPVVASVFRGPVPRFPRPSGPPPSTALEDGVEPILCTCEETHPNRPAGYKGCGAYWNFVIPQAQG